MANYYVDYTNGNDAHDGLREPTEDTYTAESGTDDNDVYCSSLEKAGDDDYNGDFFYNVTRGESDIILDYIVADDHIILTTGISGQTTGDTFFIIKAWKTLTYACAQAFSAGDIIKVRANQTHSYSADITFVSDGTITSRIHLKSCDSIDDPWYDSSDTRPTISFGDGAYHFALSSNRFWKIERFIIKESTQCGIEANDARGLIITNCSIHTENSGVNYGVNIIDTGLFLIEDTYIYRCGYANIRLESCKGKIEGCNIYASIVPVTPRGIRFVERVALEIENTQIGVASKHSTADLSFYNARDDYIGIVKARNIELGSTTKIDGQTSETIVYIEDEDQAKMQNSVYYYHGVVIRDTSVVRPGGAASSARGTPKITCNSERELLLMSEGLWMPAAAKIITVYMRCTDFDVGDFPDSDECYIEAEYFNSAISTERIKVRSTESFSANDTWTAFTVGVFPVVLSPVYLKAYLTKYFSGPGGIGMVYVDVKPVVT